MISVDRSIEQFNPISLNAILKPENDTVWCVVTSVLCVHCKCLMSNRSVDHLIQDIVSVIVLIRIDLYIDNKFCLR